MEKKTILLVDDEQLILDILFQGIDKSFSSF